MNSKIDLLVYNMILNGEKDKIDVFIQDYIPYIVKVASEVKNGYLDAQNDDEYSIAMLAFHEAMIKYHYDKGSFLSFARLVISSRLKNFWKREKRHDHEPFEEATQIEQQESTSSDLKLEIHALEQEMLKFGLTFEDLVEQSPKHEDTRQTATEIGMKTGHDEAIMYTVYEKRRLPIMIISKKFNYTVKVIKHSKIYILVTAIIFYKKFTLISQWVHKKDPKFFD